MVHVPGVPSRKHAVRQGEQWLSSTDLNPPDSLCGDRWFLSGLRFFV
jgi:hypothetical protein